MSLVLLMLAFASFSSATSVVPRGMQSEATCSGEFNWMDNHAGLSPCLVAAFLIGACHSNDFDVTKLNPNNHYDFGPDPCSCSWATYNLLSACTVCQGASAGSVQTWASIQQSSNCSNLTSQSLFYPANVQVQGDTKIPAWAGVNPQQWQDGQFNADQAKGIASEGNADLDPSTLVAKKKSTTPVGAIVGGVIGALGVLLLGAAAILVIRRRRQRSIIDGPHRPVHGRSFSDISQKTGATQYQIHATFAKPEPSYEPVSPTIRSRSSRASRAHSIFGSVAGSIFSSSSPIMTTRGPNVGSPPPPPAVHLPNPQDIIEPFPLPPQSPTPSSQSRPLHRKASDISEQPVTRAEESAVAGPSGPSEPASRRRVNPPAYTPSPQASQVHLQEPQSPISVASRQLRSYGHHRGGNAGSQDTQQSWDSYSSRNMATRGNSVSRSGNTGGGTVQHSRQTSAETYTVTVTDREISLA